MAFAWTGALLVFRKQGDSDEAGAKVAAALESNPHIPAFMLGRKRLPRRLPDLIGFGDERARLFDEDGNPLITGPSSSLPVAR